MIAARLRFHSPWVLVFAIGTLAAFPGGESAAAVSLASEEIRIQVGTATLTGTLRRPVAGSRLPGIVLVPADGALHASTARVWSDSLAARGYAVLSIGGQGGDDEAARVETALWQTVGANTAAAAQALRGHEVVDGAPVGALASGRATWALPHAVALDSSLAFAVALTGGPLGLAEQELYRRKQILAADGYGPANVERGGSVVWMYFEYLKSGGTERAENVRQDYERYRPEPWFALLDLPDEDPTAAKWPVETMRFALALNYDPLPVFATLQLPLLAVLGANDRIWPAGATARAFEALRGPDVTVRVLENADHELRRGPASPQAPEIFGILDSWILDALAPRNSP